MFSKALHILITASLAMAVVSAHGAPACETIFQAKATLGENESKNLESLARLLLTVDESGAEGTNSAALTALRSDYLKKETALFDHVMKSGMMTREELRNALRVKIAEFQDARNQTVREDKEARKKEKEKQIKEISENIVDGSRVIFNRLEPGSFKMGVNKVDVTLTKPFEIMATPVTQIVWKQITALMNERGVDFDLEPSSIKGDLLPVTDVTVGNVRMWLNVLNRMSSDGDTRLNAIIPYHKAGDQYRLPTEAEWEYMARGGGKFTEPSDFVATGKTLQDYGSFSDLNKGVIDRRGSVAGKLPIIIAGKMFYDIFGNTLEWVADGWLDHPPGGVDPYVDSAGKGGIARGIQDLSDAENIFTAREQYKVIYRYTGIRLVRDVK